MILLRKMKKDDLTIFKKWLYTPHVAKWYHDPLDWIDEAEHQYDTFKWIHHYIVERDGEPVGFCQYYACVDSDEEWKGYTALGGSYSIDYMIGEAEFIGRGIAKHIIDLLINMIKMHKNAKRIVVAPDEGNSASRGLLLSCGFVHDTEKDIFVLELQ